MVGSRDGAEEELDPVHGKPWETERGWEVRVSELSALPGLGGQTLLFHAADSGVRGQ